MFDIPSSPVSKNKLRLGSRNVSINIIEISRRLRNHAISREQIRYNRLIVMSKGFARR